jgi:23S rRNA (cytidine1920-2'-O)/16S rRNA (cytidine1409-2'-O)-methyltransferase
MEGRVSVDGTIANKAGQRVSLASLVELQAPRRYVSRGGEKLEGALRSFDIDVTGAVALDIGASTGGFTDCLLQHGASGVTAVDVGYGQIDWRLRHDSRVTVLERTNFRLLPDDAFPGGFDLIVVDASFISLRIILARAVTYLRPDGTIVALVKPQFEAGRERVARGGVVRDRATHREVLCEVRSFAMQREVVPVALCSSSLMGPAGNREFFLQLRRRGKPLDDERIDAVLDEAPAP